MWKRQEDFDVIVVSFIKNQRVFLALDALNVLIISLFSEDIERHLCSFTGPIQDFPRLVGFAGDLVCVPMSILTSGVTIESFDEASACRVWGTVAAGTDLGGMIFGARGTFLAVGRGHRKEVQLME